MTNLEFIEAVRDRLKEEGDQGEVIDGVLHLIEGFLLAGGGGSDA